MRWSSRWFLLSLAFGAGAFALAWKTGDAGVFAAIGSVALAGGHATNVAERMKPRPLAEEDLP